MNAHAPISRKPRRKDLPAHLAGMVRRMSNGVFQIVGLPVDANDPTFKDRAQAEDWLAARLDTIPALKKIRYRPCLCCDHSFLSTGPQHRLCDECRLRS